MFLVTLSAFTTKTPVKADNVIFISATWFYKSDNSRNKIGNSLFNATKSFNAWACMLIIAYVLHLFLKGGPLKTIAIEGTFILIVILGLTVGR